MLPFIHRAETWYAPGRDLAVRTADRALILHMPRELPIIGPLLVRRGEVATSKELGRLDVEPVVGWIHKNTWIAECPFCASAQVVSPNDPFFLCAGDDGCLNLAVQGAYVQVAFPDPETILQVESVLVDRPENLNRNWLPAETVADLLAENVAHDVTAPDVTLDDLIVKNLEAQAELSL